MPCDRENPKKKTKKEMKGPIDNIGHKATLDSLIPWYTNYREFWERVEKEKKKAGR